MELANRMLKACVVWCWIMPAEDDVIVEGLAITKKYAELAKNWTPAMRDQNAPPHAWLFNTLLLQMLKVQGKWTQVITDYIDEVQEAAEAKKVQVLVIMAEDVQHCRICKAYDRAKKKLELTIDAGSRAAPPPDRGVHSRLA